MKMLKAVLAGVGLAAVGYGAYKGLRRLAEGADTTHDDRGNEVDAIIEKARAQAVAEFIEMGLDEGVGI